MFHTLNQDPKVIVLGISSLVRPDMTRNVPVRAANIEYQTVTLQIDTQWIKIFHVGWVARITQQRSWSLNMSKIPEELLSNLLAIFQRSERKLKI